MILRHKGASGGEGDEEVAEFLKGLAASDPVTHGPPPIPEHPAVDVHPIRFLEDECRLVNAFVLAMGSVRKGSADLAEEAVLTLENVLELVPVVTDKSARYFARERAIFDDLPPNTPESKATLFFQAAKMLLNGISGSPELIGRYFDKTNPSAANTTLRSERADKAFARLIR
ncbi:MAG: hypothetical protein ABH851_05470 [Methanobacteriota archaeon]